MGIMSGTIVCERHWSRADYDKDLMLRARRSMEILNRAPEDTDSPYPTEGEVRMDRIECYDFLKRAVAAVDFFEPHFRIHDEVLSRAREDFSWRVKEFFSRLVFWRKRDAQESGDERYRRTRAGFESLVGQVSLKRGPEVIIENRVLRAAWNWIQWHEQEAGQGHTQGVYR